MHFWYYPGSYSTGDRVFLTSWWGAGQIQTDNDREICLYRKILNRCRNIPTIFFYILSSTGWVILPVLVIFRWVINFFHWSLLNTTTNKSGTRMVKIYKYFSQPAWVTRERINSNKTQSFSISRASTREPQRQGSKKEALGNCFSWKSQKYM